MKRFILGAFSFLSAKKNGLLFLAAAAAFFCLNGAGTAYAADLLTATSTTALTDNLIGATGTQWTFTATTTGQISAGNIVEFIAPSMNQAVPFSSNAPTVVATSSILLVTATTTHAVGVAAARAQGGGAVIYGYASSTVPAGTTFSVTLGGINNAAGQFSSMRNLAWTLMAGTSSDPTNPGSPLAQTSFSASSTVTSLIRGGGALVSDANSTVSDSSQSLGAPATITMSITLASDLPAGGKISMNLPTDFNLQNATTTAADAAGIATSSAAYIVYGNFATTSTNGANRITFTTSGAAVKAGNKITVSVGGLTNPGTAEVDRSFSLFTTKSNGGLMDGSYFGFESSDYGNGAPPPNDTIYIGGLNTLNIQVLKEVNGATTTLSAGEIAQVKVAAGCPDKQYFMGSQWLNANGVASYRNILDCNYMVGVEPFNSGDPTFYNTFLPPGMKQVNLVSSGGAGQVSTTTLVFSVPDSTSTVQLTGGVSGANAFIQAYSADSQSFAPVYTDTTYATTGFNGGGTGYARVKMTSGEQWNFNVVGGSFGASGNITDGSGNKYWAPDLPSLNLTTASSSASLGSFAYVLADKTLNVTLQDTNNSAINNACVGVSRSGGGIFMGPQDMICQPNNGSNYQFKVPSGSVTIDVSLPGHGAPAEYPVAISSATTDKTITLAAPTSFISVTVQTSGGTAIKGAPVFANGANGFGNAVTGSDGTAKIYVQPGAYSVQGFAPAFGPLTSQTATVASGSNPSLTFTVATGSLMTVSGRVTQGGSGVSGINIGAHGTGSTAGGNGTQTDANGNYTLYLPAGAYQVGGWSPSTGGLTPQSVDVSSSSASGVNWVLGAQGTLHIDIEHASGIANVSSGQLFAGAFDPSSGQGNGTNSWTASSTDETADITLPAGTYTVQAGSPAIGQFGSQSGVVITGGATTNVTFDAAGSVSLVTLSGSVTSGGTGVANVNVWASRKDAPGFFSATTDAAGNYSLAVPDALTYHVGVRSLTYIADAGDVDVPVSGNTTKNFTVTAAGSTITGKALDANGRGIADAWVSAFQTGVASSTQIGAPTDDSGSYTLNVTAGSTWSLTANGPCYLPPAAVSASAGDSGKNLTLASQAGCTKPVPQIFAVTDTTGGQISTGDITINIPPNALGTSQSIDNVMIYDTAGTVVSSANATPLGGSVREIIVTNSSGQYITSLNSPVTITTKYDPSMLPVGSSASDLQFGYFDNTTGQWEPIAGTINTANDTFTFQVSHFTEDGPILPGVPAAPTNLSAAAASASQINLSWTASPTASSYKIYRSATNANFTSSIASGVTGTSYSDTGLSAATTYYYEVAGVNSNGEGVNSSSASAATNAAAAASPASNGPPAFSGGGGGGGGGGGIYYVPVVAVAATSGAASSTVSSAAVSSAASVRTAATGSLLSQPAGQVSAAAYAWARDLKRGLSGDDVAALQRILIEKGFLVMPPRAALGYFGALTEKALAAYQENSGIAPAAGYFGALTQASISGGSAASAARPAAGPQTGAAERFTRALKLGMTGADVKLLQELLNADPATAVAESGAGSKGRETDYFGTLTEKAVEKYQAKQGIVSGGSPATTGYGLVGPKTRESLAAIGQ